MSEFPCSGVELLPDVVSVQRGSGSSACDHSDPQRAVEASVCRRSPVEPAAVL